jgi:3-phenylpropionate/trans-cinnamate dioxygenase ferredoxin reductase component
METQDRTLVVVGAGHAGSELAVGARQSGWSGRIVMIGDEEALPYQRPPLSKAYLLGKADVDSLALRPESAYAKAGIEFRRGVRVLALDRSAHELTLSDGSVLRYEKLAWCAGGRPRPLSCDGLDADAVPPNLCYLRTLADADRIRAFLRPGSRLVVIGGGYVGLELAASARGLGAEVTVVEAQSRVLARVAGLEVSAFYESVHRKSGVNLLTGSGLAGLVCEGGAVVAVRCTDGTTWPADLVVAGIGMIPNVEVLQAAGLPADGGVAVDELSRTADSDIVAAGDCTMQHPALYDRQMRIESVPNALEQARAAVSWLCGKPKPNQSLPWFWSDQYDLKLQMAGLSQGHDRCILRGDPSGRSFCAFYLREGRLLAVDAVNRPAEFMFTKRMLAQAVAVDAVRLPDESIPLKEILTLVT